LLRADNVSFGYQAGAPLVVDGVSVAIDRGDLVGILGPNGSGKTTLLRLLSGTRTPSQGTVRLDAKPLDTLTRREIARCIAVVPQEVELAFEYTVLEMVLMGRHPHLGLFQVEGPDDYAIARAALASTGTAHLEAREFHTLSGGEKQRVVIAAALAQSADVLLLDEPTASLDLGYQLDIAALLAGLNRERGVTMAISTHDLHLAASICRTLVLIRGGRVLAHGPAEQVLTPEHVRALYDVEADVHVHPDTGYLTVVPVRRMRL
jgi:iron complex transport system ATP-binding protein